MIANFKNKETYKTKLNKVKANLLKYTLHVDAPDSGKGTVQFKITKNAAIGGTPDYNDIDIDNSIIEYDTAGTFDGLSGQDVFTDWVGYSSATGTAAPKTGGQSAEVAQTFGLYLLPGETATVTAQNVAGSTNVICRVSFNWIELF